MMRIPALNPNDAATRRLLRLLHLAARISKECGVSVEELCEPTAMEKAAKVNDENAQGAKRQTKEAAL